MSEFETTCLEPVWMDGVYRVRCGMGAAGVCARHGKHRPHPEDGRACHPMDDGYCRTHGVYMDPRRDDTSSAPGNESEGTENRG
ncbi:MAG: hypothetical protein KGL39_46505 [Patescibacteria group bacterium]|nr:hypothetical protein [Patescibacteria group bacterium]